jgi:hypothetical protein
LEFFCARFIAAFDRLKALVIGIFKNFNSAAVLIDRAFEGAEARCGNFGRLKLLILLERQGRNGLD